MRRRFTSAALLQLSLIAAASAQTSPNRAPPTGKPATECPMRDQAGEHMMQPGAMPMHHGQSMSEAMEHCRTMHRPAADGQQQMMMHRPGEPPHSRKEKTND